jgi:hypothetical protein
MTSLTSENNFHDNYRPRDLVTVRRLRRDALFATVQRFAVSRVKGTVGSYDSECVAQATRELIDLEVEIALQNRNRTEGGK